MLSSVLFFIMFFIVPVIKIISNVNILKNAPINSSYNRSNLEKMFDPYYPGSPTNGIRDDFWQE